MSITNDYVVTEVLNRPNLKLVEGESYDMLIESEISEEQSPDKWSSETYHVMDIVDLETGEQKRVFPPAQLRIKLEENAPYVGNMFRVRVMSIRGTNTSRDIGLYRIAPAKSDDDDA